MKNMLNEYDEAQNIAHEIIDAFETGKTIDDCPCFQSFPDKDKLIKVFTSGDCFAGVTDSDKYRDISKVIKELKRVQNRQRIPKIVAIVSSVAAVIVLGLFVMTNFMLPRSIIIASSPLSFSVDKPTLVVGNNSIDLTSVQGTLTSDDYVIERGKNNVIVYKTKSTNSTIADTSMNKMVVPNGYMYTLVLDDGTKVFMNSCSELRYPAKFSANSRTVELKGEAYFDVAKSDKEFVVKIGDKRLTVYGTEFNIRNASENDIDVVLVSGSLGFRSNVKAEEVMIKPNQMLSYTDVRNELHLTNVNVDDFIMWRNNMFAFKNRSAYDVLNDLASWYGITIQADQSVRNEMITFVSGRETPVEVSLEHIAKLLNLKVTKNREGVYVIE